MQIISDLKELHIDGRSAVAIGKFDGIHEGHLALLSHILEKKKVGMKAVAFTFYPSAAVFFGQATNVELTTREEKWHVFEELGVDVLVEFPLNKETAATEPTEFVTSILVEKLHAAYIVAGEDLSFGNRGLGNKDLLISLEDQYDYQVEIIDKLYYKDREISSTYVREMVERGDMETVKELLGRYYSFEGIVQSGRKLGRKLGMPTLNLYPKKEKLLPPRGVYYSLVKYEGATYPGITNIGKKPTVNDTDTISVETYLYDFDSDMYGKEIVTELLHFKRPEMKFDGVEALKRQMEQDIREGREYIKKEFSI